jgi:1,4-alpha-glucan branching enzyme
MIRKSYNKSRSSCLVTFTIPKEVAAEVVHLCGDFNDWSDSEHPLTKRKDGRFSRSISLRAGNEYRFRYLLDRSRWENDGGADAYEANPFGSENSVLRV